MVHDPYLKIAMAMVAEAALDIRRKRTYKTTKADKQSAFEFLHSDFARDVLEMCGLSPDDFVRRHSHQPRLLD
jgi:hypothetical protein